MEKMRVMLNDAWETMMGVLRNVGNWALWGFGVVFGLAALNGALGVLAWNLPLPDSVWGVAGLFTNLWVTAGWAVVVGLGLTFATIVVVHAYDSVRANKTEGKTEKAA